MKVRIERTFGAGSLMETRAIEIEYVTQDGVEELLRWVMTDDEEIPSEEK